jgi:hypothetical protein
MERSAIYHLGSHVNNNNKLCYKLISTVIATYIFIVFIIIFTCVKFINLLNETSLVLSSVSYNDSQSQFEHDTLYSQLNSSNSCQPPAITLERHTLQLCWLQKYTFLRLCNRLLDTGCLLFDETEFHSVTKYGKLVFANSLLNKNAE